MRRELSSASIARGVSPFAALEQASIFAGLGEDGLAAVAQLVTLRSFEPGEALCRAGVAGDRMFVIVDGLTHVLGPDAGREPEVIAKMRRGDLVGATSLVTGEPRTATVLAAIPTDTLELRSDALDDLIARYPAILVNLNRILRHRLLRSNLRAALADERGEAVGLIVGRSLMPSVPRILDATAAASARTVQSLDTRAGFESAMGRMDELLEEHGTVVVVARAEGRSAPLLLDQVDRAVLLSDDAREVQRLLRPERQELGRDRIEVVMVNASAARAGTLAESSGARVVRLIEAPGTSGAPELGERDVAWLGRHLSRTKLGLALGAGGAKGYAHVGALYVLEAAGYTIDYISGSSIGAIVAAYSALGMSAAEIEAALREGFTEERVADMFKLSLSGASTGRETIERVMRATTGDRTFEDTLIPLTIMSVDVTDRDAAPLREGPIWEALMAATALAGLFPPYERDGHRLIDGLALVPVPTGSLVAIGADLTVSVNLMSRETLPAWPGEAVPPPPAKRPGARMLETLLEVMDLMQLDTSIRHAAVADIVITPRFGPGGWRDFHLVDLFLAAGRQAAEEQLASLATAARPQFARVNT